jgi:hypothetical protein
LRPGRKSRHNYFEACAWAVEAATTLLGFAAWAAKATTPFQAFAAQAANATPTHEGLAIFSQEYISPWVS